MFFKQCKSGTTSRATLASFTDLVLCDVQEEVRTGCICLNGYVSALPCFPLVPCRSMPGTAGVSWMALRPIWPITQAGPRRFQRDPAATRSAAVSIGVSGRLGRRGQTPAGPSETDISALRAATLPVTHSHKHTHTHTQPSSSSMFSTQCSYGLLMGLRP